MMPNPKKLLDTLYGVPMQDGGSPIDRFAGKTPKRGVTSLPGYGEGIDDPTTQALLAIRRNLGEAGRAAVGVKPYDETNPTETYRAMQALFNAPTPAAIIPEAAQAAGKAAGVLSGLGALGVVKPKGGNWLAGTVERGLKPFRREPEVISGDLINEAAGNNLWARIVDEGGYKDPHTWLQKNRPDIYNQLLGPENAAINQWVDTKLGKYVKNEMATPEDPVRALAERGILHVDPETLNQYSPRLTAFERETAGFPTEGLSQSPGAQRWEDIADYLVESDTAGNLLDPSQYGRGFVDKVLESNPWLAKVDPETPVYGVDSLAYRVDYEEAGFKHLIDELRNATNPDSGLPRSLQLSPDKLQKVTVPQAVELVDKINKWRAEQKVAADFKRSQNAATIEYKAYDTIPGTAEPNQRGLRWVELRTPEITSANQLTPEAKAKYQWYLTTGAGEEAALKQAAKYDESLAESLKYEGETMGHCVGGYCPDVAEGRSRIYSLRDKKGEPHVTIEVKPNPYAPRWEFVKGYLPQAEEMMRARGITNADEQEVAELATQLAKENMPPLIQQIKGKANRAPKDDYLPFVQDFVRSGQWSSVGDVQNTGMRSARDVFSEGELNMLRQAGQDVPPVLNGEDIQRLHNLIVPEGRRLKYNARGQVIGSENANYAAGGAVSMQNNRKVRISDNPDTMLLELMKAPRMQAGGKPPPGVRRAMAQQRGTVAPIPGIKTPAEFIGGYVGADPRFSVMDPDADALERAYRAGEATSVIGDIVGSISPFATASTLARANALPGAAVVKAGSSKALPKTGSVAAADAGKLKREAVTLSGALAPLQAPVRGETSKELLKAQTKQLTDQEKETLDGLRQTYPDFSNAVKFMTPQEVSKIIRNPEGVKEMDRLLQTIPSAKELAAVAKAGAPKQGWYRASTQALIDVFGTQDAPRFASLLAAMSPQTSVESNLINALNTWKNWTAAGRPTDPKQIKAIMGQSVQGSGTEASVLDAWTNNAMRALRAPNPLDVVLSGPKVDSFYRNLADDVYRVTNDAWMASGLGVDQGMFSGSPTALQLSRGDPGLSPGYIASSARMREAGQLNKMLPSEAQETTWSYYMPLYEMQRKTGLPAREILQRGLLTPESIRGTPDFSTLLTQGQYGDVLRQAGYGEQLSAMKPYQFPESAPSLSLSEQREVERAARRLEDLKGLRESESRSKIFELPKTRTLPSGEVREVMPESGFASAQIEYIPGEGTGILPDMITASPGTKQYFSSRMAGAFRDPQERDILQRSLGLEPLQTRSMTGSFRPSGEIGFQGNVREQAYGVPKARETNPGYASLVEVPLTKRGDIPKEYKEKLGAAEALRGYMTGQQGSTYNLQVPTLKGESAMVKLEKKADPENIRYASAMTDDDVFLADTGRGVAAIFNPYKPGNLPLGERGRRDIADYLGSQDVVPTRNISDYIDYSEALTGPQGTGAATKILQERLSPLDVASQKRLSEAAQPIAGDVLELMTKQHERANIPMRPDYARALELIKRGGIPALMAALAAGEALPAEMVSELLSEAR
jgi:hypothetical protein